MAMRLLDLFSGIGGFSYAAETLIGGYETVAFCEMDEFCQKVLKKHWPQVPIYDDVRTLDAARLGRIDICTFGFPCQPVSQAGVQKGESDDRWLWNEIIRILQVSKPKWIIAENVVGLISIQDGLLIEHCISDLEAEGYEIQSVVIPACAKNAPHRRSRIWLIGQLTTNTNDTGNRTSTSYTNQEQQTIKQGWKEQSFFEFSRHDEAVANSESIRCRGGSCKGCSDCKRQVLSAERKGREVGSEVEGCRQSHRGKETVVNTNGIRPISSIYEEEQQGYSTRYSKRQPKRGSQVLANTKRIGSQTGLSGQDKGQVGNTEKSIDRDNRQRGWETSNSWSVEQRVGDMANGISTGLLRHFDREPENIPRVTTGEKDRAKKLKALGNSIVPQVAAEILLAIRVSEKSD
jgi:DNA (cytosine-5)-methyltransferase 1